MSSTKKPRGTYADIEALPEHLNGELIDGELFVSPRPAPPHALTASTLGALLNYFFHHGSGSRAGGWWILDEPELHFGEDVLIPDIAGWRRERMAALPTKAYFELPPDWICEVASPSTSRLDLVAKMPRYASVEVAHAWIVDPARKAIEAFRRQQNKWLLIAAHAYDDVARIEPFEDVEIDLSRLWAPEIPTVHSKKPTYDP